MKRIHYIILLLPLLPCCLGAQGLRINPGAQVVATGAPAIVLNNTSLVNNGHFIAGSSTVFFTGASQAYIGGNNPISFYRLALNLPSTALQLYNNATVTGDIMMLSGNLQLNTYTLSLGSAAHITGERNEARIIGSNGGAISITVPLNAPHAVNPGNIGVEISSQANLGLTTVTRGHTTGDKANGQSGIERYFDITPSRPAGTPVTLRFFYFDAELGDNHKNELDLFTSPSGQNNWAAAGKDYSDGTSNWLLKSNITALQRFTLATAHYPAGSSVWAKTYPNPARDMFTLLLFSSTQKEGMASLCDQEGHILETRVIHCLPGTNKTIWNINRYAAGAYHLVFEKLDLRNETILKQ